MSYLIPNEYLQFIINSIDLDTEQMANYFRSMYLQHKEHNPDFKNELHNAILKFKELLEQKINDRKYRGGEVYDQMGYDSMSFPLSTFFNGLPYEKGIQQIDKNVILNITRAHILFQDRIVKNESEIIEPLPPDTIKIKLQWNGTPGEFGAIFDLLFDKGFIERIKDKKNMVRFLHSIFDVRNEKDEIVDAEYLYKCFNDKKRPYPEGQLTIPFSENYHKGKLKKPL
jgi:hypothetical protein